MNGQCQNLCQLDYLSPYCAFINPSSNERMFFVRQLKCLISVPRRLSPTGAHDQCVRTGDPVTRARAEENGGQPSCASGARSVTGG